MSGCRGGLGGCQATLSAGTQFGSLVGRCCRIIASANPQDNIFFNTREKAETRKKKRLRGIFAGESLPA